MGDRGNFFVQNSVDKDGTPRGVYLYGHWTGYRMPIVLQQALARRIRWDDEAYFTRILFDQLVGREDFGEETGFGISTYVCDNEYPILVIDCDRKVVHVTSRNSDASERLKALRTFTFEQYLQLKLHPDNPWSGLAAED